MSVEWMKPSKPSSSQHQPSEDGATNASARSLPSDDAGDRSALFVSEAEYRTLFQSIDHGFCVVELRFDDTASRPIDYRFLEVNAVFEEQSGLRDAAGRWMRELAPDHEQHWFDVYGRVALTRNAVRFENGAQALGARWF